MGAISKLVSSMGARGWFAIGLAVLAAGVLAILADGPLVVPCLAVTVAGLAFRCSMLVHREARAEPTRPWLQVEHPNKLK